MNSATIALHFRTTVDAEDLLQGFLLTHVSVEGIEESGGEMIFYIPQENWTSEKEVEIRRFAAESEGISFLDSESLEDRDWNAEWEATIEPQWATGELVISPSWHLDEARAIESKYLIIIDPKMSFGTGHHETTRLCLNAIEQIDVTARRVLDIGTGSGVLAMYALLRGARNAVGIDTDSWSIENTEENRGLNTLSSEQLEVRRGMLAQVVQDDEQFDVILANIHRNVLIEIAPQIRARCNMGASVVLSGLLIYDAEEVRKIYEATGFLFVREIKENEWACLVFSR